ncbi:MAG: glycosyltransferase family 1 protein [Bacteroidota bacterium]
MLRLGYDAKRLFHNFTGLGNYSRSLLHDLQRYFPEHEYHLYCPRPSQDPRTTSFQRQPPWRVHHSGRQPAAYWRSYGVKRDLREAGIQLFHGLSHEIPRGLRRHGIRSVVTIHDLIFKQHPELFPYVDRQIYEWKFGHACRQADRVVAISESTKADIIRWYGTPADQITVVYQTCHDRFQAPIPDAQIAAVRQRYSLPKRYLLSVGALIERKNLLGLLEAWEQLPADLRLPVVVVGEGAAYRRRIEAQLAAAGRSREVIFLGRAAAADLPALYHEAELLVYPSLYEGFGIPLIEALFCGTPVLTSSRSSLPEAAGPGAHYVDPRDTESMRAGLEKVLQDSSYRTELRRAGGAYVQRFRGRQIAEEMMAVYQEVMA